MIDIEYEEDEAERADEWLSESASRNEARQMLYKTREEKAVELSKMRVLSLYETAKAAKVGTQCTCAGCQKQFTKKSYQQAFCSNKGKGNCKDVFWNRAKPERTERAIHFSRRAQ